LSHINFVTDDLHDNINKIYEAMADNKPRAVRYHVTQTIKALKAIVEEYQEEY
jgi:hypothetical protein